MGYHVYMQTLPLTPGQESDLQARLAEIRQAWVRDMNELADVTQAWSERQGWNVSRSETEIAEEVVGGAYQAPVLTIDGPEGRLILKPVARGGLGADGRVDLYAWPSHYRVMLLHTTHRRDAPSWIIRTESGLDWPQPWGEETFAAIARGLMKAE